jgi:spermidine synthase
MGPKRENFYEQDPFSPLSYVYAGVTLIHQEQSPYQKIAVLEHPFFGRMLALNDVVQFTERDEFFYHEMLVHVPLHAHPSPRRVLVVGGGDGGSLREVLKHPEVREAWVAELDRQAVEVSRRFFPGQAAGFADPRSSLHFGDGAEFVKGNVGPFDVVLVDSTDPVGRARRLFTLAFFRRVFRALGPQGILVAQTESLHFHLPFVRAVQERLRRVFPVVDLYTQALATYAGSWWSFSIASKDLNPRVPRGRPAIPARYYSREVHRRAFLPRALYRRLMAGQLPW